MIVPASMALAIIKSDDPRLPVSGGLRAAPVVRRINRKSSQQQKQHGGHCQLPVVMRAEHNVARHTTPYFDAVLSRLKREALALQFFNC